MEGETKKPPQITKHDAQASSDPSTENGPGTAGKTAEPPGVPRREGLTARFWCCALVLQEGVPACRGQTGLGLMGHLVQRLTSNHSGKKSSLTGCAAFYKSATVSKQVF